MEFINIIKSAIVHSHLPEVKDGFLTLKRLCSMCVSQQTRSKRTVLFSVHLLLA